MAVQETYTFGMVPASIAGWIGNFVATSTTRPTFDETEALIKRAAGRWCGFIEGMGITPSAWDAETDSTLYQLSQDYIGFTVAARVLRAKDRTAMELAAQYDEEARKIMDEVREHPQSYGQARPTSANSPNIPYSAPATEPARWAEASRVGGTLLRNALVGRM